jgi:hypothetical protein
MPYRRLPNTDMARLRAIESALKKCLTDNATQCPVSENLIVRLETMMPKFQHGLINLEAARSNQILKNKDYSEILKKARIYISHFIQVLNFSIQRGELKPTVREFYELVEFENNVPPLLTEKEILKWGKTIIAGEQKRVQSGGNPIYNPSIALVKVNYEKFYDAHFFQRNLKSTTQRASELISSLRPEIDQLILDVWNEVEDCFSGLDENEKRTNAEKYGLVYVFRKKELFKPNPVEETTNIKVAIEESRTDLELVESSKEDYFSGVTISKKAKVEKEENPISFWQKVSEKISMPIKSVPVQTSFNF